MKKIKHFLHLLLFLLPSLLLAQGEATIYGVVANTKGKLLEFVNISRLGEPGGTVTNNKGRYELKIPANKKNTVVISYVGYVSQKYEVTLNPNTKRELNVKLTEAKHVLPIVDVKSKREEKGTFIKINPKHASNIPSVSNGVEAIIKTLPGVTSTNEMSSQYSVRGGNFDENLVYVNGIQIYRPFLTRSGQQEGLSFINTNLISDISFSAGGFDATYGDKMSSVLDVTYKKPEAFAGSASVGLLGASAYMEGISKNKKFDYLLGIRKKSNKYLLNSMQTKGAYNPSFFDVQLYTTYDINRSLELAFLGHCSNNKFLMIPKKRETNFGTLQEAYKLTVFFEGKEADAFQTITGAMSANYKPNEKITLRFIASAFNSQESESFDILGAYWLDELEVDFGNDEFGEKNFNKGIGAYINHARNYLNADVLSLEHKATLKGNKDLWNWGVKYSNETINDKINEWNMIDSAGYSLPHNQDSINYVNPALQPIHKLHLNNFINSDIHIQSNRYSAYLQRKWFYFHPNYNLTYIIGVRSAYWDKNEQIIVSPRTSLVIKPLWKHRYSFRIATGMYQQPPFYRELRCFDGTINEKLEAQRSIHFLIGSDYKFEAWGRPFKYSTEIYYKKLDNLVPYEIDDVRIRYYAKNMSHGYATGLDMKINGEFVKNAESWASLSLLQTKEDIEGDVAYRYYNAAGKLINDQVEDKTIADSVAYSPGYIPRPTDRRINFSLFFQDYLPKNPTYKMYLNLLYGSGLPFGPPSLKKHVDTLRMPPYFRVDIGFSKQLIGEEVKSPKKGMFKYFKSLWISAEVFNLLQNYNTISYLWIKDIENRLWPTPNYLTLRRPTLRLIAKF